MEKTLEAAVRRLIRHSFTDLEDYGGYNGLCSAEKDLVTPEEFAAIMVWLDEEE